MSEVEEVTHHHDSHNRDNVNVHDHDDDQNHEIPVACISPELCVNRESALKQVTRKDDHMELNAQEWHDVSKDESNCHERVIISGGSMQMQLADSPDNDVTAAVFESVELMPTYPNTSIHGDGSEKSSLESVFTKPNATITHGHSIAIEERESRSDGTNLGLEICQDDLQEHIDMTDCKVNNFFMSTSYAGSTAKSSQLTLSHCGIPRQLKMRTDLALSEKVRLIQVSENTGKSQRSLAAEFGISLGSVNNILRRKREYIEAFERNEVPTSIKSFRRQSAPSCSVMRLYPAVSETDRMNTLMSRWIEIAKKKNVPLSASLLQDKATEFASKLCISDFNPSVSWVTALKHQLNLHFENEFTDSTGKVYTTWTKMLPYLIQGYEPQNVFTCGETTLVYRGLPDKCLTDSRVCMATYHRTHSSDHSVTILLCCSAVGEKIKPLVIGDSRVPNSFRNVTVGNLPIVWRYQEKSSMTASLFTEWLKELDKTMAQQNRHIALFMDMAPGHLSNLLLRNVRLQFYLDNSSSYLQPLQQGIVTAFKANYRIRFLQAVLAWAEGNNANPMDNITELDLVFWIKHSWSSVKKALIVNCFDAVGFPTPPVLEGDADEGISPQLAELIEECGLTFKFFPMNAKVYVQFDSQIPCHVHETEPWEQQLLSEAMYGSVTVKNEPDDDFPGSKPRHLVDGHANQPDGSAASRAVSQHEALECLTKLKMFASSDKNLLDVVYASEKTMLESISNNRQQARYRSMSHLFPLNMHQHGIL